MVGPVLEDILQIVYIKIIPPPPHVQLDMLKIPEFYRLSIGQTQRHTFFASGNVA